MQSQSTETRIFMENLEHWRISHDYSMRQFAEMLGINRTSYSKLVSGETTALSIDMLHRIYDITGYLCFQLMEVYTDDFLKTVNMMRDFTPHEMKCMKKFIEVYIETKNRI